MIRNKYHYIIAAIIVIVSGCIEPYTPPASKNIPDILVVDGFLNTTDGTVSVILSKATALTDISEPPPVLNATIYLEDSEGGSTLLNSHNNGMYTLNGIEANDGLKYRIRITVGGSKEYTSDFITPKATPEIDSVTWRAKDDDGVEIRVNTHDDTGNSRYYLWDFDETWQYRPTYGSNMVVEDGVVRTRRPEENVYDCWKSAASQKILIGSSARLSQDIISQAPIHFLNTASQEISVHYSILVRQTAISETMYEFYEDLRKTTEELGSLFDPQPGRVIGNIHSTGNSGEVILGIFNGGDVKTKRIFIKHFDLPDQVRKPFRIGCELDSLSLEDLPSFQTENYNLVSPIVEGPTLLGYTFASLPCTDCRVLGGKTIKPSFWP